MSSVTLGKVKGPQGPIGVQGPKGKKGVKGNSVNIQKGVHSEEDLPDPSTVESNIGYIVDDGDGRYDLYLKKGTNKNWTIQENWQGPKGLTGDQGEIGEQGEVGEQGDQGDQGEQGPKGLYATPTFSIDENGHLILEYEEKVTPPVEETPPVIKVVDRVVGTSNQNLWQQIKDEYGWGTTSQWTELKTKVQSVWNTYGSDVNVCYCLSCEDNIDSLSSNYTISLESWGQICYWYCLESGMIYWFIVECTDKDDLTDPVDYSLDFKSVIEKSTYVNTMSDVKNYACTELISL